MLGEIDSINLKDEGCFLLFLGAFILDVISPKGKRYSHCPTVDQQPGGSKEIVSQMCKLSPRKVARIPWRMVTRVLW